MTIKRGKIERTITSYHTFDPCTPGGPELPMGPVAPLKKTKKAKRKTKQNHNLLRVKALKCPYLLEPRPEIYVHEELLNLITSSLETIRCGDIRLQWFQV